jgi:excisionase family DNA binding protein
MGTTAIQQEVKKRIRNPRPPDPDVAETWTVAEACRRLGIGTSTGYALIARDEFPVRIVHIGGTRKILKAELTRYLEGEAG